MKSISVHHEADEIATRDVIVVGSGIAGLTAALGACSDSKPLTRRIRADSASPARRVTILTKTVLGGGSSSQWAQGGVAAAMATDDSPHRHAADTVTAGAGLGERQMIDALTAEGPQRIRRLIELGARFDRGSNGELSLGREGAHSRRRILHAGGDATGAEMVRALVAEIRRHPAIELHERCEAQDLVTAGDRVVGVLARHRTAAGIRVVFHRAAAVVLATGGLGQLYARTTNPVEATGDGLAMAARAGARLADLEMIQFHPTALDVGYATSQANSAHQRRANATSHQATLPLVTEALRGEGAVLIDADGVRFMTGVHPQAELGPRDIVARAIRHQQEAGRQVFLDATAAVGDAFPTRFPTVWNHCQSHGIDPRRQPIPVTPAAHYAMAGIAVDACGRSSLPGLWACGEVTSTGVHGANRLASNSLLEALVFGARVADDLNADEAPRWVSGYRTTAEVMWREPGAATGMHAAEAQDEIRQLMWRHVGLERHRTDLEAALDATSSIARRLAPEPSETHNLLTLSRLVTAAALAREESRGSHYRSDFPEPREDLRHRMFWTYEPGAGSTGDNFPLTSALPELRDREIA